LKGCKSLQYLSVNGAKVTKAGVTELKAARPGLHIDPLIE